MTAAPSAITYSLRPAGPADLEAVTALWRACDVAEYGAAICTLDETRSQWQRPGFDLAADAWVAETAAGQPPAAYGDVWARDPAEAADQRLVLDVYLHPDHRAGPVGAKMLAQLEARATARLAALPPGARGRMLSAAANTDAHGLRLHAQAGYRVAGHSWVMRIENAVPPPAPAWPAGIALRPFRLGLDERPAHALINEAFSDLGDYRPVPFDRWAKRMHERAGFDPRWWFLAWAPNSGGEARLAGAALCFHEGDRGWVSQIAVRRAWRRQGLALALLRHAFGAFYQAGVYVVELGVDAANATGATRVYERAGMRLARHYVRFEKLIGD